MEVYILDSLFRRDQVVDKFESLIWTDRWQELGDFELDIQSTIENRSRFLPGTRLATNTSYRVMTVETVEDATDAEGESILTVKGRSLEATLEDRVAMASLGSLDPWVINEDTLPEVFPYARTPGNIIRYVFDQICRVGVLQLGDKLPFLVPGTIFPAGTIPESTEIISWEQPPDTLLNIIRSMCAQYDLGFRLVRNFDTSQLYFDIYSGSDRTTTQQVLPPVVFSPSLDNLQNTKEFTTIQQSKNVAYLFSEAWGNAVVYADGVDPDVDGFDRRVLLLTTVDIPSDTEPDAIEDALDKFGKAELRKTRGMTIFDGELNQNSAYKYETHYFLGDLVEMRNIDGVVTKRRVTEQIFACDREGERSYPTLAGATFDGNNTWLYQNDRIWQDFGTTEFWSTQA